MADSVQPCALKVGVSHLTFGSAPEDRNNPIFQMRKASFGLTHTDVQQQSKLWHDGLFPELEATRCILGSDPLHYPEWSFCVGESHVC